ncbi:Gfo/Idh/MocA family protein [Candidatus Palauibacter sp.]|uniref:Gfo/Idh/MocA family protein n=1 Tax=Candidatus Palauibacter sp. TaxID=3101350 RepID=UPI003AF270A4
MTRRLTYGMVGGGPGAFIGDVHRMAAELDGLAELAAGAFSSDAARSAAKGADIGLDPARVYGSYAEMADVEAARPDEERLDFVIVVTPNHLHFDVARTFLEADFHVVCDKPLTTDLGDAEALCRLVDARGRVFALTHNYSGYPMIKDARHLIREGRLGEIRRIQVEYFQGWLATPLEETGHPQAAWRTDPAQAGVAGALGDIGTHAHHLARYVTGLEVEALCGELTTFVPGRRLEDDASLLMRWTGGVRGTLTASQVAAGEENGLALRVFGSEGSLAWRHDDAETLWFRTPDGRARARRRGHGWISPAAASASRVPPGHPEGFIEGFANLYRNVISTIGALQGGRTPEETDLDFPTVRDGARGVHFIERAVESGQRGAWVDARYEPPGETAP